MLCAAKESERSQPPAGIIHHLVAGPLVAPQPVSINVPELLKGPSMDGACLPSRAKSQKQYS